MEDLGLDPRAVGEWFEGVDDNPAFRRVNLSPELLVEIEEPLGVAIRRCYISDDLLEERREKTGLTDAEVLELVLPPAGPVMAGDFGEILAFIYHAASLLPGHAIGPKKWRLKGDQAKPITHTDVLHLVLPGWPDSTPEDLIACAEVKTKSTKSNWTPIESAIRDSAKDRAGRLAETLVWLRRNLLLGRDVGGVHEDQLDRFINLTDHPPARKRFSAIAVLCASLADDEIDEGVPEDPPSECDLIVITVPNLKDFYSRMFDSVAGSPPLGEGR